MVKIFKDKKIIGMFMIIVVFGIVLMIGSDGYEMKSNVKSEQTQNIDNDIENRLSEILSKVRGAGKVSVMITYNTSAEKIIAYNINNERDNSAFSTRESYEAVVNGTEPIVLKEVYPEIKGVLIVAQGGGNTQIKNNLINATQSLLGIDVNKIEVLVMKKEE